MTKNRIYPPCMLVVNGREFILTDVNENRVKEKLYKLYRPDQIVEEWIDGKKINELELRDIFNK